MDTIKALRDSGPGIHDPIPEDQRERLFLTPDELETALESALRGSRELQRLANRTRSKRAKQLVCEALGYPVPSSFPKVQPRFPGQDFDVYVQKSDNLQIWNEEVAPERRYVLIRLDGDSVITRVKVVTGEVVARLDRTGTLTQKFQATLRPTEAEFELISASDTPPLAAHTVTALPAQPSDPTAPPTKGSLLAIDALGQHLRQLVGLQFEDPGVDQERNRGRGAVATADRGGPTRGGGVVGGLPTAPRDLGPAGAARPELRRAGLGGLASPETQVVSTRDWPTADRGWRTL